MQSYTEIPSSQSIQSSLALLLSNDKTALSCSSGSAFPTTNLQAGMLCFRTDQLKLYLLKDTTPTWVLLLDLNGTAAGVKELVAQTLIRAQGGNEGGEVQLEKPPTGSTLSSNLVIDLYGDKLRIFDNGGTNKGFYIDLTTGAAGVASKLWHSDNDGASSGLDADLLDGYQSGNATGQIPISNGTNNVNLNADLHDGYHAGNATGQVPVSNGTVNTNLNADMLDGYHSTAFVRSISGVAPDASGNVALAASLPLTGGTMTGAVVHNTAIIAQGNNGASRGYVYNDATGIGFLDYAGGWAAYVAYGTNNFYVAGALYAAGGQTVWHAGNFSPTGHGVHLTNIVTARTGAAIATLTWNAYGQITNYTSPACNCSCTCFLPGTKVLMASGEWKALETIKAGEQVVGMDGTINTVLAPWTPVLGERKLLSVNDGELITTGDHLVMTTEGWGALDLAYYMATRYGQPLGMGEHVRITTVEPVQIEVGTTLLRNGGEGIVVRSIEVLPGYDSATQLYTLVTDGDRSFTIDGGVIVDGHV